MLSFQAEFPVGSETTATRFLSSVKKWLLGSPHTVFKSGDLEELLVAEEWKLIKSRESVESLKFEEEIEQAAAVRYKRLEESLEWVTTVVFSRDSKGSWIGIRVSCDSNHPTVSVPIAKKPVLLRVLLDELKGGSDGDIPVLNGSHKLANSQIDLASSCIWGTANCKLPIVYVSSKFREGYVVDVVSLGKSLSGMAHVLVEPNRAFSVRLKSEVNSENAYGGAIGVYWPEGTGSHAFFISRLYDSPQEIERAVIEEVRVALVNKRPQSRVTWAYVQELISKKKLLALRLEGSHELKQYISNFDSELQAKSQQLVDAEREIMRLKADVRRYQSQSSHISGLFLKTGGEQDLYPGEIRGIVFDAIEEARTRVLDASRRQHVLANIAHANPPNGEAAKMHDLIKAILRDYRSMDSKTRRSLEEIGFEITEDGKHYKMIFQGDGRYIFTLSKSGSDVRGGLNQASDINRLLF